MFAGHLTALSACWSCHGTGMKRVRIFPACTARPCFDHVTHSYVRRCRWCRGSCRTDIITIAVRYAFRVLGRIAQ